MNIKKGTIIKGKDMRSPLLYIARVHKKGTFRGDEEMFTIRTFLDNKHYKLISKEELITYYEEVKE